MNSVRSAMKLRVRLAVVLALLAVGTVAGIGPASADFPVSAAPTWQANDDVNELLPVGDIVYIGGKFTQLDDHNGNTVTRNRIAAISSITGAPTSWAPDFNNKVFDMATSPDGQTLYVVGTFTQVDGKNRKRFAAFDIATGDLLPLKAPTPNKGVRAVAASDTTIYIGGFFDKMGGVHRLRLGAFDATTGDLDTQFTPEANKTVRAIMFDPGRLHVAGSFSKIDGVSAKGLVALDPTTGTLFSTDHPSYPVLDIALDGNQIFVAGAGPGGRAAAYDRTNGDEQWNVSANGNIQGVGVSGTFAYFGGHHDKMAGQPTNQLSRIDKVSGTVDTAWTPIVNGIKGILDVDASGDSLFLAGDFTKIDNEDQQGYAQLIDDQAPSVADLSIVAAGDPANLPVGDDLTYTVDVSNAGPASATAVAIVDPLPAELQFQSSPDGCYWDGPSASVRCDIGLLASGNTETRTFVVRATAAGTVDNTMTVESDASDPDTSDNTSTVTTTIDAVPGTADVGVTVTDMPDPVEINANYDYVIVVANDGPDDAFDVVLTEEPPAQATVQTVTTTAGTCTTGVTIDCDLGTVAAGASVTVTVTLTAPATPMTLVNEASITSSSLDPDMTDDAATSLTTVADTSSGDVTPPQLVGLTVLDGDADGLVDEVVVDFDEPLATCNLPCTSGWSLLGVPSGGELASVATSGATATLSLTEGPGDPSTAVGSMTVALDAGNEIQDPAGNHASFAATAPADGAGPVPITVRKKNAGTNGLAESGDAITVEWSEVIALSSVPATVDVTLSDPSGAGNDLLDVPSMMGTPMDTGSDDFLDADGGQVQFLSSDFELTGVDDATKVTLSTCSGDCASLQVGPKTTVVYVPSPTLTDLAGNSATGSFTKTFRLF